MKKTFIVGMILFSILILSCEDSFNPYSEFRQKYGVACILRSDTTFQFATILRNYMADENSSKPRLLFEENADVRIWYQDSVYRLKDTSIVSSNGTDTIRSYVTKKFSIDYNKNIEIEILLSDGKRLKAVSQTPAQITFKNTSEVLIPPINKDFVQINWNPAGEDNFYQARLQIKCEIIENGLNKIFYKTLPKSTAVVNGVITPIYPKASKNPNVVYELSAIEWYLQHLADSLEQTSAVSIHQMLNVEIMTFDKEVSRYLSVSSSSIDNLSIRFDEGEYTNIKGGLGIFGSKIKTNYTRLKLLESYITSFGFNFIYDI